MRVLSLCSGVGGMECAANDMGHDVLAFCELDKNCNNILNHHWPEKHIFGDLNGLYRAKGGLTDHDTNIQIKEMPDLIMAGSSCQDFSILNSTGRLGLEGSKSRVFYQVLRMIKETQAKHFLIENVGSMSEESRNKISEMLGVEPVAINSSIISAQNRPRLYWFNWDLPEDAFDRPRQFFAKDVFKHSDEESLYYSDKELDYMFKTLRDSSKRPEDIPEGGIGRWSRSTRYPKGKKKYVESRITIDDTSNTLTTGMGCGCISSKNIVRDMGRLRMISPLEAERLQMFPDNWTAGHKNNVRYKMMGNAVTVGVIAEILRGISK